MRRHQVAGSVTPLHLAQPSVAGPSGDGLRSIGTEAQLTDLEGQLVALRQLADRPCDGPAVRPNAVIDVRHHERSEEHTSELQSHSDLVCRLLLEKKNKIKQQKKTVQHLNDNT